MKANKKMKIEDLKIQSFVTSLGDTNANTVKGGMAITYPDNCTVTRIEACGATQRCHSVADCFISLDLSCITN